MDHTLRVPRCLRGPVAYDRKRALDAVGVDTGALSAFRVVNVKRIDCGRGLRGVGGAVGTGTGTGAGGCATGGAEAVWGGGLLRLGDGREGRRWWDAGLSDALVEFDGVVDEGIGSVEKTVDCVVASVADVFWRGGQGKLLP